MESISPDTQSKSTEVNQIWYLKQKDVLVEFRSLTDTGFLEIVTCGASNQEPEVLSVEAARSRWRELRDEGFFRVFRLEHSVRPEEKLSEPLPAYWGENRGDEEHIPFPFEKIEYSPSINEQLGVSYDAEDWS
ncbi:hypothetical protein SynBIOSE41_00829 [Synechococcus sp. BIOS-E4-1]|uniref:hypothetical protein n=1 Tax=Synechococcus sp. BIOS-E4-1 TaxID=1400864 RepID=UPI0016488CC0|nr:hypothetical protein [Synechococcus sp. BIOS-E4-1]QNI53361.1 hypothetical protein SynBIOSE41_00829 [Synechococcus sp. BIOS-E4-1]